MCALPKKTISRPFQVSESKGGFRMLNPAPSPAHPDPLHQQLSPQPSH